MEKVIVFFVLLTLCSTSAFAQNGRLKGTVTDSTGNHIGHASVLIQQLLTGATTDTLGNYMIENIAAGNYLVWVSVTGYNQGVARTVINSNQTSILNFTLVPRRVH